MSWVWIPNGNQLLLLHSSKVQLQKWLSLVAMTPQHLDVWLWCQGWKRLKKASLGEKSVVGNFELGFSYFAETFIDICWGSYQLMPRSGGSNLYQKVCTFNEGSIFKTLHRLSYWECYSWLIVVTKCCRKKPTVVICFDAAVKQKNKMAAINPAFDDAAIWTSFLKIFLSVFQRMTRFAEAKEKPFLLNGQTLTSHQKKLAKNDNLSFLVTVCTSLISTFSGTRKWCICGDWK